MAFSKSSQTSTKGYNTKTAEDHQDSNSVTQYTENYPVRRSSKLSTELLDLCLRIKINSDDDADDDELTAPDWIQFQALVAKDSHSKYPSWSKDKTGRSIVNPSESANPALLAVGARSLQSTAMKMTGYTSRGPVFSDGVDVTDATPNRLKPDVVGSTDAATYTKWRWSCHKKDVPGDECDDLYFTGTSAATGHVGGLAALAVQWLKRTGADYDAVDVANFLRHSTVDISPDGVVDNGFVVMPCVPTPKASSNFRVSYGTWTSSDCQSKQQISSKADYYTFYLSQKKNVVIELSSSDRDTYLVLRGGASPGSPILETNDNVSKTSANSEIDRFLEAGIYTIEVTHKASSSRTTSPSYALEVASENPSAYLGLDPGLSSFKAGSSALSYRVYSEGNVWVLVNASDDDLSLDIATSRPRSSSCTATLNDYVAVSNRDYIYLSGCAAGDTTVRIYDRSNGKLLNVYRVKVNS